jgi:hypothetical protein
MGNNSKFVVNAGQLRPGWDAKTIITLAPGERASIPCDPSLEQTPAMIGGKVMRRLAAQLRIDASYKVHLFLFSWSVNYLSPTFYCKHTLQGLKCSENQFVELDLP